MAESGEHRSLKTLDMTGSVTRDEVVRWQEELAAALAGSRGLRIELAESGPWDLTGLQLLLATIVSGKRAGWPIVLAHVPGVLTAVAERAGVCDHLMAVTEK